MNARWHGPLGGPLGGPWKMCLVKLFSNRIIFDISDGLSQEWEASVTTSCPAVWTHSCRPSPLPGNWEKYSTSKKIMLYGPELRRQGWPNSFHRGPHIEEHSKGCATHSRWGLLPHTLSYKLAKSIKCRSIMLDNWICFKKKNSLHHSSP